jgi:hypothetical protein
MYFGTTTALLAAAPLASAPVPAPPLARPAAPPAALHAVPGVAHRAQRAAHRASSRRACSLRVLAAAAPGITAVAPAEFETDASGLERLRYRPEGWNYWTWRTHRIQYVVHGSGPPVVLVHGCGAGCCYFVHCIRRGCACASVTEASARARCANASFGANAYHWRYNIAELSKNHTVYCICLLGYVTRTRASRRALAALVGSRSTSTRADCTPLPFQVRVE